MKFRLVLFIKNMSKPRKPEKVTRLLSLPEEASIYYLTFSPNKNDNQGSDLVIRPSDDFVQRSEKTTAPNNVLRQVNRHKLRPWFALSLFRS